MSLHERIEKTFPVAPYACRELRGLCLAPFAGVDLASIPWKKAHHERFPQFRLEKSSQNRKVVSLEWDFTMPGEAPIRVRIYAKQSRVGRLTRRLISPFRASKAAGEWRLGRSMRERGIPTPLPLIYAERREHGMLVENYLVTLELVGASAFFGNFKRLADDAERTKAMRALARFIRRGYDKGFYHDDCSAHHVFVDRSPAAPNAEDGMYFIDVDNGRMDRAISRGQRIKNAFQIVRSLPPNRLSDGALRGFIDELFGHKVDDAEFAACRRSIGRWQRWKTSRKDFLRIFRSSK